MAGGSYQEPGVRARLPAPSFLAARRYNTPMTTPWTPVRIAAELEQHVLGQPEAVREVAVAIARKLAGLPSSNVLMIGSSGTGKTTLMRAVESFLERHSETVGRPTLIRVHANVLAEEAERGQPGTAVLQRLLQAAKENDERQAPVDTLLSRLETGIVFIDEVDKIRANVGERPNVRGIRAQEALLTLIESEAVAFDLPDWAGGGTTSVDSRGLLFVCAGAFEGLYDAIYDRVTVGEDRGALKAVTVIEGKRVHEERPFHLRDWLRPQDLFDYGMSPQFLSRFDAIVLLDDLDVDSLTQIFTTSPESRLRRARDYFASFGIDLELSDAALRRIAVEASKQHRIGARALGEVFGRIIRRAEFEPERFATEGKLRLDEEHVERALGGSGEGRGERD
jgi:ATP-dependent Clp protease ATP-binding subunit ClpX